MLWYWIESCKNGSQRDKDHLLVLVCYVSATCVRESHWWSTILWHIPDRRTWVGHKKFVVGHGAHHSQLCHASYALAPPCHRLTIHYSCHTKVPESHHHRWNHPVYFAEFHDRNHPSWNIPTPFSHFVTEVVEVQLSSPPTQESRLGTRMQNIYSAMAHASAARAPKRQPVPHTKLSQPTRDVKQSIQTQPYAPWRSRACLGRRSASYPCMQCPWLTVSSSSANWWFFYDFTL